MFCILHIDYNTKEHSNTESLFPVKSFQVFNQRLLTLLN